MRFTDLVNIMSSNGVNSLAEIARELKVSPQSVSNWKARDRVPYKYVLEVQSSFEVGSNGHNSDVADNIKKQGGFIPGVQPGKATSDYIDRILTRVTLPASIFLALIAVFPSILFAIYNQDISYSLVSFYGGTSLLIIVGVALDTLQQIESHMLMRNYDGFLKSGRIRGRSRRY